MPGPIAHVVLASDLLDVWGDRNPQVLADPGAEELRWAFLLGCLAPDAGYMPGGTRILSDAAHYASTGRLVEVMDRSCRTDQQRAFTGGWLSHVEADAAFHPRINQAAARVFGAEGEPSLTYADDRVAHAWVENLLDAALSAQHRQLTGPRIPPALPRLARWLSQVYGECYGVAFAPEGFAASLASVVRTWPRLRRLHRVLACPVASRRGPGDHLACVAFALGLLPILGVLAAFRYPGRLAAPATWLRADPQLLADWDALRSRFAGDLAWGPAGPLPRPADRNLDTGQPGDAGADYAPARAIRTMLARRSGP